MRYLPLLLGRPLPQEDAHDLDAALGDGGVPAVRTAPVRHGGVRSGADAADAKRLLTIARYSMIELLPMSYLRRIEQVPGVVGVANAEWFGARYQNESNAFPVFAVDPTRYLDMYPEFDIAAISARPLRKRAPARWPAAGSPSASLEGRAEAADRVGDPPQDGRHHDWEFDLVGIIDAEDPRCAATPTWC
jgi:putative ABC transport system permease protein